MDCVCEVLISVTKNNKASIYITPNIYHILQLLVRSYLLFYDRHWDMNCNLEEQIRRVHCLHVAILHNIATEVTIVTRLCARISFRFLRKASTFVWKACITFLRKASTFVWKACITFLWKASTFVWKACIKFLRKASTFVWKACIKFLRKASTFVWKACIKFLRKASTFVWKACGSDSLQAV